VRIFSSDTIALVIDIQEKLFPHIDNHKNLLTNSRILLAGLDVLKIPVVVTEQYPKGLGSTLKEISNLINGFNPISKISFSCCGEKKFLEAVQNYSKRNIIICGIETHVCVLQTVMDLIERGYHPVIIEDCVSSRKSKDREIALKRMAREGVIITTYESILFELCEIAGTDQFKQISKLVK
jgi:nicotinamidase-related amidase